MFEKVFGPKRDEVTAKQKRLHNKELHQPYSSTNSPLIKSTRMRCVMHMGIHEEHKSAYKILLERHDGNRPLGRPSD